jgi:ATP-dependent DNA helicase RecQ
VRPLPKSDSTDVTEAAQKALSAVHRLGGRFDRGRIIDHLLGKTKDAQASETQLSTFGIRTRIQRCRLARPAGPLQFEGLLREDPNDGRPLIGLGEIAGVKAVYRGEQRISMRQMTGGGETARTERARKRHGSQRAGVEAADAPLFEALRAWRRERAAEQRVPPYVICHDTTLSAIARKRPASLDDLAMVSGVDQSNSSVMVPMC